VFPGQTPGRTGAEYLTMGTSAALLLFLSVLLHELAHSAVARSRGVQVEGITLFIFGGVAQTKSEAQRPIDEFLITVVGPITSLALAGLFWAVAVAADFYAWPAPVGAVAGYIGILNLVLAVFNMVPGFPLDGGRIFRSLVWQVSGDLDKATRWATYAGRAFGYALVAFGLLSLMQGFLLNGLWMAFIGWFLANAAAGSYRSFRMRASLARVHVSRVMAFRPVVIPEDVTIQEVVDEYFLRRPFGAYPVVAGEALVGLLSVDDASAVPAAERATTRVSAVMRPVADVPTATETDTLDEVLSHMEPKEEARTLILRDGQLVGIVTLGDVAQWVRRSELLGRPRDDVEGA
jgi:Zn-dependent protease/CBS domain-containing protein